MPSSCVVIHNDVGPNPIANERHDPDGHRIAVGRARRCGRALGLVVALIVIASCGSGSAATPKSGRSTTSSSATSSTTAAARPTTGAPCGATTAPPNHYTSVVVFSFENRRWDEIGPGFGTAMPYLHNLGNQCSWFPDWNEINEHDKSLGQYVGQVTGAQETKTVDDCKPSATCNTTADNLFRQVRNSGRSAINYVEGATTPCSADGNKEKHIPALYLWGADDRAHCDEQVRPFTEFDPKRLPAFAFVTPTLCHDGHDCSDQVVDTWSQEHVQPVLDSAAYRAGKVAVFIWYDESAPVPNLWITPTALAGARAGVAAGSAATLRAWQSMLDVPCLANACSAPDLRTAAHS